MTKSTNDQIKSIKEALRLLLPDKIKEWLPTLLDTDERLVTYLESLAEDDDDAHSCWEIFAAYRFFYLMQRYDWRSVRVKRFINFYEKIKFSGLSGRQCYKLTPIQVFQFASIFGFARADGRRLVRQAILFVPRKFGKTTSVASLAVFDLLAGDSNGQAYMAANSEDQSGICFNEARAIIEQLDPNRDRFRTTDKKIAWKKNKLGKESFIRRLTAGAKSKDGYEASFVVFDEYAAARYVKDHSDGAALLNVLTSSMGTRTDPLTVIITTASRVINGPFESMLDGAKSVLLGETVDDTLFASLFQPDPWELANESLYGEERIWKKCNPHLGITVQPDFYAMEWQSAQHDTEKKKEFLCKYLNIFQTDKVRDWIKPDEITRLQSERRIDDFTPEDGKWVCFVGMDFSKGDDLCGMSYLCYNASEKKFFCDCDAWITQSSLENHTNSALYRQWQADGWLRVTDGPVIPENVVTDRLSEVAKHVQIIRIGYDPYDSGAFVNYLTAWLRSMRANPDKMVHAVRQTNASFSGATQDFERLVKQGSVEFAPSPLLPWCFGNAILDEDKMENVKPIKRTANGKIDIVICLLEGIILLNGILRQ